MVLTLIAWWAVVVTAALIAGCWSEYQYRQRLAAAMRMLEEIHRLNMQSEQFRLRAIELLAQHEAQKQRRAAK